MKSESFIGLNQDE